MRRLLLALALGCAVPAVCHAEAAPKPGARPDDPVVAQRGGITITASGVRDMVRYADPDVRRQLEANPQALTKYVRDQVLRMALLAEARDRQWDARPDIVYRANQAHDAAIAESYLASVTQPDPSYPSDAEVAAAYDANRSKLMLPRQYHLAQIYYAIPAGGSEADTERKLAALREQLSRGRADFAATARRQSDDKTSGANGGDIGWVREDQLAPALRTIVPGLADGGVSDPVKVGDGWHLVKLLGTKPAAPAALSDVREALVRALRQQKQQQNAQAYVADLQKQQPIQLNEIGLAGVIAR